MHCHSATAVHMDTTEFTCVKGWPEPGISYESYIYSIVHLTLDGVNGKWCWRRNLCQIDGESSKLRRLSSARQSLVTVTPLYTIVIYTAIFEWCRMYTTLFAVLTRQEAAP